MYESVKARTNLHILTGQQVTKLILNVTGEELGVVTGVEVRAVCVAESSASSEDTV